jgi:hypothetical protein
MARIVSLPADAQTSREASSTSLFDHPLIQEVLGDSILNAITVGLEFNRISEKQVEKMMRRHGEKPPAGVGTPYFDRSMAGPIWLAHSLLRPTGDMTEHAPMVYEAHCREILERVVAGEDTRPGSAPEMILALSQTSMIAPLTSAATGLYLSLFTSTFPGHEAALRIEGGATLADYERMHGQQIHEHFALLRKKLTQPWRTVGYDPS